MPDASGRTESTTDAPSESAPKSTDRATAAVKDAAATVRDKVTDAGRAVQETAGNAYARVGEKAHDSYDWTQEHLTKVGHDVDGYVREKPLIAMLVAATLGALLGAFWKRRD